MAQRDIEYETIPCEDKPKDKRLDRVECKALPKLPANILLLGKCGSGKSSILWSMLSKGYVYGKKKKSVFDEAIYWLGTLDAKSSFEKLPIKNHIILDEFDPELFEEYTDDLKKHQMEKLEAGQPPLNTLIVFDDFAGANVLRKPRPNVASPLQKLVLTSRHEMSASVVYLSQVYKGCGFTAPAVRNNITTFIISKMSRSEIEKIAEEISGDYEPAEWIEIYDLIMARTPYTFVVLDTRRPVDAQWTEKFTIPFPPSKKSVQMKQLLSK